MVYNISMKIVKYFTHNVMVFHGPGLPQLPMHRWGFHRTRQVGVCLGMGTVMGVNVTNVDGHNVFDFLPTSPL